MQRFSAKRGGYVSAGLQKSLRSSKIFLEFFEQASEQENDIAESLVVDVTKTVLARHGKELTQEAQVASMGKRVLDAWQSVIDVLDIRDATAQQLYEESEPLLCERCDSWPSAHTKSDE